MSEESRSSDAGGRFWQGLRALLLGNDHEITLRDQIEEAIEEHDENGGGQGDLSLVERQMLKNLLHFGERRVIDVAVPRSDIIAFDDAGSFADLVALFREAGHSRIPVFTGSLDEVQGMIHVRDVYAHLADPAHGPDPTVESLMRPVIFVPESMGVLDLLARMRAERTHLAIVVDEYGGTDGIVTIEDLVEEIVGDIEDEHDEAVAGTIQPMDGGLFEADARASLEDVAEQVDARLVDEEGEVDTLGGLTFLLAGRVPVVGEIVEHPTGWQLEVIKGDNRHIERLRLHPPVAVSEAEA